MMTLAFAWALAADAPPPDLSAGLETWRRIVVHAEGSRIKPFDSYAREICCELFGRQRFAPKDFDTISAVDVRDWPALAAALRAPAADAPNAPPRTDGRTDRFKAGDPGDVSALARLRELLSVEDRKLLRDTDFAGEAELKKAFAAAEDAVLKSRRKVFPRNPVDYTLDETRAAAAEQGETEVQEALARYDAALARWLPIQKAKARVLTVLNAILGFANLYQAEAWTSSPLPAEALELVKAGPTKLERHRLGRLNRFLLSAALPTALAPPGAAGAADPQAKAYDSTEACLTLIFSWQGWDAVAAGKTTLDPSAAPLETYFASHALDGWDRVAWLQAGHVDLAPLLQPETDLAASLRAVLKNDTFRDHAGRAYRHLQREQNRAEEESREASRVFERLPNAEQRALTTVGAAEKFQKLRLGFDLGIAPPGAGETRWLPLFALLGGNTLPAPYTTALQAEFRTHFLAARAAFLANDGAKFAAASTAFASALAPLGEAYAARLKAEGKKLNADIAAAKPSAGGLSVFDKLDANKEWDRYPDAALIDTEMFYNRFDPFWKSFWLATAAFFVGLLALAVKPPAVRWIGYGLLVAAVATMCGGLVLRSLISGRAPVVEFFDTVVWAGAISGILGAFMGLRWPVAAIAASALIAVTNGISVNLPLEFGVGMRPIQPVLRSEKWLYIHVMTIVASYGAFMLAWLLSLLGLGYHLVGSEKAPQCKALGLLTYRTMLVGVLLLATGTFLGGWWASDAWGRFWGWDPKETFALVALLTYLAVLHARFVGVKSYGTMVGSALAFTMVVASWYGVNFILKAGKHAYAFNTGGQWYVIGGVLANLAYVATVATVKSRRSALRAESVSEA